MSSQTVADEFEIFFVFFTIFRVFFRGAARFLVPGIVESLGESLVPPSLSPRKSLCHKELHRGPPGNRKNSP